MTTNKKCSVLVCCLVVPILQFAIACSPSRRNILGEQWVIFPAERAKEMRIGSWLLSDDQTIDYWSPSKKDILALEDDLPDFLETNTILFDSQKSSILDRLDGYHRQYVGFLLVGRKIIYANYFCNDMGIHWETEYVFILDGGDCYFQFKYDVETGDSFDLRINGEA